MLFSNLLISIIVSSAVTKHHDNQLVKKRVYLVYRLQPIIRKTKV